MLECIILGFLICKNHMSGYELKQEMNDYLSYIYDASFGSIYPALKRLVDKEYVVCEELVENGKFKKLYAPTDLGKAAFFQWLEKPIVFAKANHGNLGKIIFYDYLPIHLAIRNLKAFRNEVLPHLEYIRQSKREFEKAHSIGQKRFLYSTLQYGEHHYQSIIEWCDMLIQKYDSDSSDIVK